MSRGGGPFDPDTPDGRRVATELTDLLIEIEREIRERRAVEASHTSSGEAA